MRLSSSQVAGFAASFGAIGLAIAALVVSIVETRIMREEQHMSVWPRLMAATSRGQGGFQVVVQNKGLGPAQVRTVVVGTPDGVFPEWSAAFESLLKRPVYDFYFSTLGGAVLMPGETIDAVTVERSPLADSLSLATDRLRVDICYCSAYEDCWWLRDDRIGAPRSFQTIDETESCDVPEGQAFLM